MRPKITIYICILALFMTMSCKKNNSTGPEEDQDTSPNPNVVTKVIGSSGGELSSKDGLLTLNIPEGAIENEETLSIEPKTIADLGTEFGELANTQALNKVYELKPDGLQFQKPITVVFSSEEQLIKNGDTLVYYGEYLFTSDGTAVEALDSTTSTIDYNSNTLKVEGQLSHFSPLVTSQANNGVSFFVFGVPDQLQLSNTFQANAVIAESDAGSLADEVSIIGSANYRDRSGEPILPLFGPTTAALNSNNQGTYSGQFDYSCTSTGLGIFAADLSVSVNFALSSGDVVAESYANFLTTVNCISDQVNTIDLTVVIDGDGQGKITSDPMGIDCDFPAERECRSAFSEGSVLTLTASPSEGSDFDGWSNEAPADCGTMLTCVIDDLKESTNDIVAVFNKEVVDPGDEIIVASGIKSPADMTFMTNPTGNLSFNVQCDYIGIIGGLDITFVDLCNNEILGVEESSGGFLGYKNVQTLKPSIDEEGEEKSALFVKESSSARLFEIITDSVGMPAVGAQLQPAVFYGDGADAYGINESSGVTGGADGIVLAQTQFQRVSAITPDETVIGGYDLEGYPILSAGVHFNSSPVIAQGYTTNSNFSEVFAVSLDDTLRWWNQNNADNTLNPVPAGQIAVGSGVRDMAIQRQQDPVAEEFLFMGITTNLLSNDITIFRVNDEAALETIEFQVFDRAISVDARVTFDGFEFVVVGFGGDLRYLKYDPEGNKISEWSKYVGTIVDGAEDIKFDPTNENFALILSRNNERLLRIGLDF